METIPSTILTATQTPTEGALISTTSSVPITATVFPTTIAGSSEIFVSLLGIGIVLIVVISIIWFLKYRHK
jgi:hypothetical protein